jgi:hypothetical protein
MSTGAAPSGHTEHAGKASSHGSSPEHYGTKSMSTPIHTMDIQSMLMSQHSGSSPEHKGTKNMSPCAALWTQSLLMSQLSTPAVVPCLTGAIRLPERVHTPVKNSTVVFLVRTQPHSTHHRHTGGMLGSPVAQFGKELPVCAAFPGMICPTSLTYF